MSTFTISAGTMSAGLPAPWPRSAARAGVGPARLTRRGRLVLSALALVLLVVAAVLMSGGAPAAAGSPGGVTVPAERVTVRPGETLWAIAEREAPDVDPRETIARILDLNALESSAVVAGSVLLLPAR
ncbi:MAG: LysM peptidoglycan-binding domain-containing protein [Spirochaetaceae bacterium]|nr:LysM peptidoglycan-binding domain-containing protein [Spirochaetaceae bacterium]